MQIVEVDRAEAVRRGGHCHPRAGDVPEQEVGEGEVAEVVGSELQLEAVGGHRLGGIMIPALLISRSISPSQPAANSLIESRLARSRRRTSVVPVICAAAA